METLTAKQTILFLMISFLLAACGNHSAPPDRVFLPLEPATQLKSDDSSSSTAKASTASPTPTPSASSSSDSSSSASSSSSSSDSSSSSSSSSSSASSSSASSALDDASCTIYVNAQYWDGFVWRFAFGTGQTSMDVNGFNRVFYGIYWDIPNYDLDSDNIDVEWTSITSGASPSYATALVTNAGQYCSSSFGGSLSSKCHFSSGYTGSVPLPAPSESVKVVGRIIDNTTGKTVTCQSAKVYRD